VVAFEVSDFSQIPRVFWAIPRAFPRASWTRFSSRSFDLSILRSSDLTFWINWECTFPTQNWSNSLWFVAVPSNSTTTANDLAPWALVVVNLDEMVCALSGRWTMAELDGSVTNLAIYNKSSTQIPPIVGRFISIDFKYRRSQRVFSFSFLGLVRILMLSWTTYLNLMTFYGKSSWSSSRILRELFGSQLCGVCDSHFRAEFFERSFHASLFLRAYQASFQLLDPTSFIGRHVC